MFGSSFYKTDLQNKLLLDTLEKSKKEFLYINPLDYNSISSIEVINNKGSIQTYFKEKEIRITSVFLSRKWRTDCVIDIPLKCRYPNIFRQKVQSFLEELRFVLCDVKWFPGKFEDVEKSDSKLFFLKMASRCGLKIPSRTVNSFFNSTELKYRKVLGYSFSISFGKKEKEEVAVTLLNSYEKKHRNNFFAWQWQDYVKVKSIIRCVVIKNRVWSYLSDSKSIRLKSLREVNMDRDMIVWKKIVLPNMLEKRLVNFVRKMGLTFACPEFILNNKQEYIFVDLNPCGDWYGFYDKDNQEIAREIVKKL